MKKRKKLFITLIVALCIIIIAGVSIIAASSAGSQDDPLVALSYLNETAKKSFLNTANDDIEAKASALEKQLGKKIDELDAELDSKTSSGGVSASDVFSVVTLSKGQTVTCSVGCELMLRIGTAEAYGEDYPALVDTTTASSVSAGTDLVENHMYMVTIKNCGVEATASVTKILIRGTYTVD